MAQSIELFMSSNLKPIPDIEYQATDRLIDPETGEPVVWKLRPISTEELTRIQKKHTRPVFHKEIGRAVQEVDAVAIGEELACACIVWPDLKDAKLQESYGVRGEIKTLRAILSSSKDYSRMMDKVNEITSAEEMDEDDIGEAKN